MTSFPKEALGEAVAAEPPARTEATESKASAREAEAPRSAPILDFLGRWRVKLGVFVVACVVVAGLIRRHPPLFISKATPLLFLGLALIGVGALIRLSALGTLRKNEQLATSGIYSLVRHPLYLGSTLLFAGFAVLMHDGIYWYLGLPYLAIFFTAAAIKEERFLRAKFGAEFDAFKKRTPAFLPFGRFSPGEFSMRRAMQKGGYQLIATLAIMLVCIEVMARWMSQRGA